LSRSGWALIDDELRNLVGDFKKYHIPIDILIIDMDWHNTWGLDYRWKKDAFDESIGWTGYTWNKNLFPSPEKFLAWTETQGLKTALNLHPASGIAPMEMQYHDFAKAISFDTTSQQNIPLAIEDKKWTQAYFNTYLGKICW
jgi:alpha-glucosidase (family GH31 glycosyl hydrolase)